MRRRYTTEQVNSSRQRLTFLPRVDRRTLSRYLSSVLILKQAITMGMGADSMSVGHLQLAVYSFDKTPKRPRFLGARETPIVIVVMCLN